MSLLPLINYRQVIQSFVAAAATISTLAFSASVTEFTVRRPDGTAVEGANIVSESGKIECTTDASGFCRLNHEETLWLVQATKPGYADAPISKRIFGGKQYSATLLTLEEAAELDKASKAKAEEQWRSHENEVRTRTLKERANRHKGIKEAYDFELCVTYGQVVRNESPTLLQVADSEDISKIIEEVKLRKLPLVKEKVAKQKIQIGMTECHLYAARGLPKRSNRSVGRWGEHVQHVYPTTYVYTENGRITSWQD